MNLFRTHKKDVGRFLKLTAIFIAVMCLSACRSSSPFIIPNGSLIEWTKDELNEAFWEYEDELNEVAEIVLASESLKQRMIDSYDDGFIAGEAYKKYFSDEDWGKIVDLFEKIRPYELIRSLRLGDDVVWIDFSYRKVKGGYLAAALYYFKNPETAEAYGSYVGRGLEHLDGYWYISEKFTETSLILP